MINEDNHRDTEEFHRKISKDSMLMIETIDLNSSQFVRLMVNNSNQSSMLTREEKMKQFSTREKTMRFT